MKIITWNCNMAFRKKWMLVLKQNPDILIIQECESKSKFQDSQLIPGYNEFIWIGQNVNKGMGIISFNHYHIQISEKYTDEFKYVVPINVTGASEFNLFAIWAMPHKIRTKSYVGQIWNAVNYYRSEFQSSSVLAGDWNSNAIWNKERKNGNHSHVVDLLAQFKIQSVYHELRQEEHGEEKEATLFLLKKKARPYHLDYCFVSSSMLGNRTSIEIGQFDEWIKASDHMPVIIDNLLTKKT